MFTPELQIFSIQLPLILNVNYCKHWYTKPAYPHFIRSDSHPSISKTNACAPDFHICYQIKLSEVWWKFGIDVKTALVLQMDLFQGETCWLNSFGRLSLWKHLYLMAKTCHQTFYSTQLKIVATKKLAQLELLCLSNFLHSHEVRKLFGLS